ncbi:MAG: archaellin/type IV pilin N-terminal domain-containing protein [Metallosphaera yellowstonensis]|jgi:archaeal flagellin N-terminal-like domain|uniref:Archaeal flagellin-like protein n=1 Tax=Metallosphaera yellowstonensis MK1 TaxID=671065 RepID=H2C8W1_9CREN|nr:archaellin/type IV pilin N-terminal domain-containing protein [Metallosphaera yellowstonensis]EHP68587.1 archaeal flagellin-like protein [Metallosphaera yellowstonensis MK1]
MKKAISEIFSALLVTVVILALAGPLMYYFNQTSSQQRHQIENSANSEVLNLMSKITVIELSNNTQDVFIYNYGSVDAVIQEIILGQHYYEVDFHLPPGDLVRLSQIMGNATVNGTLILKINGNYYYY